jgi:hypothetical protein
VDSKEDVSFGNPIQRVHRAMRRKGRRGQLNDSGQNELRADQYVVVSLLIPVQVVVRIGQAQ